MRIAPLIALATLMALPAAAQTSVDCSNRATQLDMNFCARDGWGVSDAELNRLWAEVKPLADRQGSGAALLDEQRAWLRRRDATCEGERDSYAGGSIAPLVYWQCMDRMTIARNDVLRALR
ncbi:lysozyme inhibitor LprI family protein [uncultured Jannaschia sp.]|uniref:lysozyme inhibitor LprI family protein n=1 Tax=uncultured Jannaschia sp. TaxID=293347 RepID=UPI002633234B|nr:lysozyme inhibitor LprI family protein [uncultured Jannaschia sp.]